MRVCGFDDRGVQWVVYIKCDKCDATIRPTGRLYTSGWTFHGFYIGPGTDKYESDLCPKCQDKRPEPAGNDSAGRGAA